MQSTQNWFWFFTVTRESKSIYLCIYVTPNLELLLNDFSYREFRMRLFNTFIKNRDNTHFNEFLSKINWNILIDTKCYVFWIEPVRSNFTYQLGNYRFQFIEPKNHWIVLVGRDLKDDLISTLLQWTGMPLTRPG